MALALRLAGAGHPVVIGSRVAARAIDAAAAAAAELPAGAAPITGADNAGACAAAALVIIAVPYEGLDDILTSVASAIGDRVVVSSVVPVRFTRGAGPALVEVPAGSASEQIATQLPGARVVGALQTVSSVTLRDLRLPFRGDIILTGDHDDAKRIVAELLGDLGEVRLIDGGGLRNIRLVEQLTVLLLLINARYHRHTGVTITDLPDDVVASHWTGLAG